MANASVCVLAISACLFAAQVNAEDSSDRKVEITQSSATTYVNEKETSNSDAESESEKSSKSESGASTIADGYKISVVGVGDVSRMPMTMEMDLSRIKRKEPKIKEHGHEADDEHEIEKTKTKLKTKAKSLSRHATGGDGAGSGFMMPNLGIAIKIEPVNPNTTAFAKLGGNVKAIDDKEQKIVLSGTTPTVPHFAKFEKRHPDAQYLYLPLSSPNASKLKQIEGELLVTAGQKFVADFDGTQKQKKTVNEKTFALDSVDSSAEGIRVAVVFPEQEREPSEKFSAQSFLQAMKGHGRRTAVIIDNKGEKHLAQKSSNDNDDTEIKTTSEKDISEEKKIGTEKREEYRSDTAKHTFTFAPLPEGRTIKSVQVSLEEKGGETKAIPFKLENIELK